jgi:hypothetical protein
MQELVEERQIPILMRTQRRGIPAAFTGLVR